MRDTSQDRKVVRQIKSERSISSMIRKAIGLLSTREIGLCR